MLRYITMAFRSNMAEIPDIVRFTHEECLSVENEIRYTWNMGHIQDTFRREQYLDRTEWEELGRSLENVPYHHVISYPPPGEENAVYGSANFYYIHENRSAWPGPKLEWPIGFRAQMDGTIMIDGLEHRWGANVNTMENPYEFMRTFAREACREAVPA